MTTWLTLKQVGGVAEKPADSFVIVVKVGPKPIGRRAIGILSIFQTLTTGHNFLRVRTGVGCLEKKPPANRRCGGEQYTHKCSTYRVAQHDHFSSREHAWLKSSGLHIFVSLKQLSSTCHVSFFSAPDTDHQHKFSLTHFIHFSYLADGLTFAHKPYDSRPLYTLRCPTAEWRTNTNRKMRAVPSNRGQA